MKRLACGQFVADWVAERVQGDFGRVVGIGLQRQDERGVWRLVAGVAYEDFNGANVVCHIAGEGRAWANREYLWTIFDYAFNQMKVKRVTALVAETNGASRRFVEHLGFEQEARLYGAHPSGDILIYCAREPQAQRWLNLRTSRENLHQSRLAMAA